MSLDGIRPELDGKAERLGWTLEWWKSYADCICKVTAPHGPRIEIQGRNWPETNKIVQALINGMLEATDG